MYIDVIFNPNFVIRDMFYKNYENYDINNEEDMINLIDDFSYLKNENNKVYNLVISVLYQDYVVVNNFENKKFKQFDSFEQIDDYINYNDPTILIDFIISTFKFGNMSSINQTKAMIKSSIFSKQIMNISNFYLIDYIDLARDIVKEDLLCLYYNIFNNSDDNVDKEVEALDYVMDQVYTLFSYNKDNYYNLMNEVFDDAYGFYKSESLNRKLDRYEYSFIGIVETNRVNNILSNPNEFEEVFWDALTGFRDYNKKTEEEKKIIKKLVKGDKKSDN